MPDQSRNTIAGSVLRATRAAMIDDSPTQKSVSPTANAPSPMVSRTKRRSSRICPANSASATSATRK